MFSSVNDLGVGMKDPVVAFIGAGHMATHLIEGLLLQGMSNHAIWASRRSDILLQNISDQYRVNVTQDNQRAASQADIIFLAVKPQDIQMVAEELQPTIKKNKPLIVSLAVAVDVLTISNWLQGYSSVVRAMPNLPVKLGQGVTGLYAHRDLSKKNKTDITQLMQSLGSTIWLKSEDSMDKLAAISGSGPAYFFYFMQSLQEAAMELGFNEKDAKSLVVQTACGAVNMAEKSDGSLAELCASVAPKGGTTEQALSVFIKNNMADMLLEGVLSAEKRAKDLAETINKGK